MLSGAMFTHGSDSIFNYIDDVNLARIAQSVESSHPRYYSTHMSSCRRWLVYKKLTKIYSEGVTGEVAAKRLGLPVSTTYNWLSKHHPLGRNKVPLACSETGYIIGAGLGDGTIAISGYKVPSGKRYRVSGIHFKVRDESFAAALENDAKAVGFGCHTFQKQSWFHVTVYNGILAEMVLAGKKSPKTLTRLLMCSLDVARSALRGIYDAEGTVYGKYVSVCSTNDEMIELYATLLDFLKIDYFPFHNKLEPTFEKDGITYKRRSTDYYRLFLRRCCYRRFAALVNFEINRKREVVEQLNRTIMFRKTCGTSLSLPELS